MKKGGVGGANTKTGLYFEGKVDFLTFIKNQKDYSTKGNEIFYNGKKVGLTFKKYGLYKFLEKNGVDYTKIISKRILPDDAIFIVARNTLFIIEVKFQEVAGSTDEKLQTCDFKIKQYRKLLSQININVEYIYILNDWFKKPEYKDVLDYIISVNGCSYYFNYLPLKKIGLPVPKNF
ncbi:MAG: hypothetical protein A3I88_03245 [Candidatus Portnoybacteria bacterium RIFCSPLOWO2_12_FULL_39_9]|uniref:Uncharacterized protein n=1 Tax=Candidatus Portnoybacteria bacterium RIFCSPHIGHO2_12_FULL_38_9 TaxID=1801997 RepID=A0A1G2FFA9_9BACT|nr:MAG: hypothetical protein A3H00_00795 [Candidatus Portnoybacteria bacterium RBG_13_40_8]OGZ36050.1 MAG: hypothetical protein A2646_00850 [Candidatus Portnoybacteria bacterium RIFCSPHIGHO2_02_FULL_39_12]OGZ36739.1 MAG: hypothetical protein A3J64_03350 [Candidatus Portnoybacteria bacterium RIFCSPHIGHO2_12_FULL_38_9]OGZ38098.1 MAG: hypothetical protein A3F21_00950 [Candidatus Portnoybacteria bacterium RIFCSPLOWO2_01_FULL_38_39]OGZ40105.1 MAG: hypothetical protein A3I88_03245 [Candidatus Portnoy